MIRRFDGQLEVDTDRGVIYFHRIREVDETGTCTIVPVAETNLTVLRVCQLEIPDNFTCIDISHMYGASVERDHNKDPIHEPHRPMPMRPSLRDKREI